MDSPGGGGHMDPQFITIEHGYGDSESSLQVNAAQMILKFILITPRTND